MRGSRLPRHIAAFPLLFPLPARSGLWASLRHPVSRGFERASARRHRKRYFSHSPGHAHFTAFCVLLPKAAFSSPSLSRRFTRTAARLRRTVQSLVKTSWSTSGRISSSFPAYGLWGKLSDQTEFPNHGSSPAQQNDSPDAHFLCGPEKCCISLLPAHFGVFRYLLPAGFAGHFARTQVPVSCIATVSGVRRCGELRDESPLRSHRFLCTLRADGAFPPLSSPTGCRGNARVGPNVWVAGPCALNMSKVLPRSFCVQSADRTRSLALYNSSASVVYSLGWMVLFTLWPATP